jgi:hypothetical protein
MFETVNKLHINPADRKIGYGCVTVSQSVAYGTARKVDDGE